MTISQEKDIAQPTSVDRKDMNPQPGLLLVLSGNSGYQTASRHLNVVWDLLREKGWQVRVCFGNNTEASAQVMQFSEEDLFSKPASRLACIRDLVKSIPRYDIVHLVFPSEMSSFLKLAPALILGRFFGKKVVLSYHRNQAEVELERVGRWFLPFLSLCDTILVSSNYLAEIFSRYNVTVEVVPDGVNRDMFRPRIITSVQPKLIVARSLENRNNISCVIEAFKLVKQKYPRSEMVIAGDGSQRESLEWLVEKEKLNGINFTGGFSPHQLADLFAEADVYVNASTIDGLPTSLLEALAVGLPAVTTGAGGIPEVVNDRVNGLLVRPNDPSGLADRIIELVESPELVQKLSQQAKLTAGNYSWSQIKWKWLELYHDLNWNHTPSSLKAS